MIASCLQGLQKSGADYEVVDVIIIRPLPQFGRRQSDQARLPGRRVDARGLFPHTFFTQMSHPGLDEHQALSQLGLVLKELSAQAGGRPVALVYDPQRGFVCAVAPLCAPPPQLEAEQSPAARSFRVEAPTDWWRSCVAGAVAMLSAAQFVPGSLVGLLWKKAKPNSSL